MKIVVPAIGSRGDVQPYIALCQGLQQAGHQVTLATNPTLCELVAGYGLHAVPVGAPVDMGLAGARLWAESGNNMWLGLIRVMRLASRLIEAAYPDILSLCRDADLVVTTDIAAGAAEADALGRPWVSATLQPGRVPLAPDPSPSASQRLMARLVWPLFGALMIAPINRFRRRVGAPPVTDIARMLSSRLILVPVSGHVAVHDPRWPAHAHLTGYWLSQQPERWSPPPDLKSFLQAGERPIAVSLGVMSLVGEQAAQSAHIALEAIRQAGVRAIVQGWDQVLDDRELPRTIYRAGSMPHTWLFDQVSAVVHHGGFGTTAAALYAGVPGIVVPHVIDQMYWAQRVFELGVGPRPVPRGKLNVERLRAAIVAAVGDNALRAQAAALGRQIRAEPDGAATAVGLLSALAEPGNKQRA